MPPESPVNVVWGYPGASPKGHDVYFSADVETDGSIPGPFSMLSFGLVYAGAYDGNTFYRPPEYRDQFYVELCPISQAFEREALDVNGLDRDALTQRGEDPSVAMTRAAAWVREKAGIGSPVIVAYPLSFDWMWLYWYFVKFSATGSPFGHSRGFDIKTALSIKLGRMVSRSGRSRIPEAVKSSSPHTHNAIDDAIEQADKRESDADFLAVVAADLQRVRAPTRVAPVHGDAAVVALLLALAAVGWSSRPWAFMTR